MRINLETDYAVRIVFILAQHGSRLDANSIASRASVTPRFSLKILHKLTSAGIVKSFKGSRGGYELAKPPGEITLREVIELTEGAITFSRCLCSDYSCEMMHDDKEFCFFNHIYDNISSAIIEKLEGVTFQSALEHYEKFKAMKNS